MDGSTDNTPVTLGELQERVVRVLGDGLGVNLCVLMRHLNTHDAGAEGCSIVGMSMTTWWTTRTR